MPERGAREEERQKKGRGRRKKGAARAEKTQCKEEKTGGIPTPHEERARAGYDSAVASQQSLLLNGVGMKSVHCKPYHHTPSADPQRLRASPGGEKGEPPGQRPPPLLFSSRSNQSPGQSRRLEYQPSAQQSHLRAALVAFIPPLLTAFSHAFRSASLHFVPKAAPSCTAGCRYCHVLSVYIACTRGSCIIYIMYSPSDPDKSGLHNGELCNYLMAANKRYGVINSLPPSPLCSTATAGLSLIHI